MRIVVSSVVLTGFFVLLLGDYPDDLRRWAANMVAFVLGRWLR